MGIGFLNHLFHQVKWIISLKASPNYLRIEQPKTPVFNQDIFNRLLHGVIRKIPHLPFKRNFIRQGSGLLMTFYMWQI